MLVSSSCHKNYYNLGAYNRTLFSHNYGGFSEIWRDYISSQFLVKIMSPHFCLFLHGLLLMSVLLFCFSLKAHNEHRGEQASFVVKYPGLRFDTTSVIQAFL